MKLLILFFLSCFGLSAQERIGDFVSLEPLTENTDFVIPDSHVFQKIIETGDPLTQGGTLPINNDFTAYVPINGSNENGYLSINSETAPGGVTILDINFDPTTKIWQTTFSEAVDFSGLVGTVANCSGTVTPWNTVVSCEEFQFTTDLNLDGYNDFGWCIEIDPATKTVIDKLWALGNFQHENVVIHNNERTVYQGADSNPGYLYKFVADNPKDLSSGSLYVYTGSKNGSGNWIQLNNGSPAERNTTLAQSANVGATSFSGIEDVEIGPNGLVYFAVKNEDRVYRFRDSDPLIGTAVSQMETFVGNAVYPILHNNGTTNVDWGPGNDNLAFDGDGNLWVMQDKSGAGNYIWVVGPDHTQASPNVKIFGRTPTNSEPTGITFSPDYRFMFMSVQHPNANNDSSLQTDIAGNQVGFNKSTSLVIALKENLGTLWYLDADNDGYAAANTVNSYNSPGTGYTTNTLPITDCDDNDAEIHPETIWYRDADGDSYAAETTVMSCISPGTEYTTEVLPATDCDDTNASIQAESVWYLDADGDGYAVETTVMSCTSPGAGYTTEVLPTTDCDDTNANIQAESVWYLDADDDGYAVETTVLSCSSPGDGYTTEVLPTTDCNDDDSSVNTEAVWYLDSNMDGYAEGETINSCNSPGLGYTTEVLPFEKDMPVTEGTIVYPNPSTDDFFILLNRPYDKLEVTLVNALEQLVLKQQFQQTRELHFNLSNQSSGIYFVRIDSLGKTVATHKIIKK